MGALIILHGLFLVHCNTQAVAVDGLAPQMCQILAIQDGMHDYQALGAQNYLKLPDSIRLKASPAASANGNPNRNNLGQRVILLNSSQDHILAGAATTKIMVPMPDDIYAANAVYPKLADLLNGTPPTVLNTMAQPDGVTVRAPETIILSYGQGGAFTLTDGGGFTVNSQTFGNYNAIAIFAWPVRDTTDCTKGFDHKAMNVLVDIGSGNHPTIKFIGLPLATGMTNVDDAPVSTWGLTDAFLRPLCIKPPAPKKGKKRPLTITQTGCAVEVIVD